MITKLYFNIITKFNFNILQNLPNSEKKEPNYVKKMLYSWIMYIVATYLIIVSFTVHLYIIYEFEGDLLIFTFIYSLIFFLLFLFKKELVVKNLKDMYFFYKKNFKVFLYIFLSLFLLFLGIFCCILFLANPNEIHTKIDMGLKL